jgi:hypothetical protein
MLAVMSCSPLIGNLPMSCSCLLYFIPCFSCYAGCYEHGIKYNKQLQDKSRLPIRGEHDITASITRETWNTI